MREGEGGRGWGWGDTPAADVLRGEPFDIGGKILILGGSVKFWRKYGPCLLVGEELQGWAGMGRAWVPRLPFHPPAAPGRAARGLPPGGGSQAESDIYVSFRRRYLTFKTLTADQHDTLHQRERPSITSFLEVLWAAGRGGSGPERPGT